MAVIRFTKHQMEVALKKLVYLPLYHWSLDDRISIRPASEEESTAEMVHSRLALSPRTSPSEYTSAPSHRLSRRATR